MRNAYLAIDLGASSGRAVLGRLEDDGMKMEDVHRFATPILEESGHLFWNIDALWREIRTGMMRALEAAPDLRSVSVDSWAVDYVPLDSSGEALRRPFCYRDVRTEGVMEESLRTVPDREIFSRTGIQFLPFNTLYQVLAETIRWEGPLLTMADYFNYRLSGRAAIEVSMASTTQMMDVHTRRWSADLLEDFRISCPLPEIVDSGTFLGPAMDNPNVDVVASCSHDTACAVAASPGSPFISCGTWSLMGVELNEPILSEHAMRAGFTNEAGIDGSIRFLKNLTGLWTLQECAREWGITDWEALEEEARSAAPSRSTIKLEDRRFLRRGEMEARLRGYLGERGEPQPESRAGLVRLVLESVADGYRRCLGELEAMTGVTYGSVHLVGGGSRNALLCELTAEACRRRVTAGPAEATALGNLLIQARTMGDLPPKATIREMAIRSSELREFIPTCLAA